jgi:ribosomal protein S18 acetylase RimI-like enzyme
MAAKLLIRAYENRDEGEVVALWREVFPDDPPHHDPIETIRLKIVDQPELFFVAAKGEAIVGTIMAGYDGHRGWIYRVAVSPRHQRQGIGSALMRHAVDALVKRGAPKINLQVRATNQAVVSFYKRLGFVVEERISMGKRVKRRRAANGD